MLERKYTSCSTCIIIIINTVQWCIYSYHIQYMVSLKPGSQFVASTCELVTATNATNSHVRIYYLCLFARIENFSILANVRSDYLANDYSRVIATNFEPGFRSIVSWWVLGVQIHTLGYCSYYQNHQKSLKYPYNHFLFLFCFCII